MSLTVLNNTDMLGHILQYVGKPHCTAPVAKKWDDQTQKVYYDRICSQSQEMFSDLSDLRKGSAVLAVYLKQENVTDGQLSTEGVDFTKYDKKKKREFVRLRSEERFSQILWWINYWHDFNFRDHGNLTPQDLSFLKTNVSFMDTLATLESSPCLDTLISDAIRYNDPTTLMRLVQGHQRDVGPNGSPHRNRLVSYDDKRRLMRAIDEAIRENRSPMVKLLLLDRVNILSPNVLSEFLDTADRSGNMKVLAAIVDSFYVRKDYRSFMFQKLTMQNQIWPQVLSHIEPKEFLDHFEIDVIHDLFGRQAVTSRITLEDLVEAAKKNWPREMYTEAVVRVAKCKYNDARKALFSNMIVSEKFDLKLLSPDNLRDVKKAAEHYQMNDLYQSIQTLTGESCLIM